MKFLLMIITAFLFANVLFADESIAFELENDVWVSTDYYYSQGLCLEYANDNLYDAFVKYTTFLNKQAKQESCTFISLNQNIYTPQNIKSSEIQFEDRPFAASLFLDFTYHKKKTAKTILSIGVIGNWANGYEVQSWIHSWNKSVDNEPHGWVNQMSNDLILNYQVSYIPKFMGITTDIIFLEYVLNLGTYDISAKTMINLHFLYNKKNFSVDFTSKAGIHAKIYDATLLGGMFTESPYTIAFDDMQYMLVRANAELALRLYRFNLITKYSIVSPEFKDALWHNYLGVKILWDI